MKISKEDALTWFTFFASLDEEEELMRQAGEEAWPVVVHDCSNRTKFARGINQRRKEGAWFGAADYGSEFSRLPYWAFLPILEDDSFRFLAEEPLPEGYRPGGLLI